MKKQRTLLVDLLRIFGYFIIPCFFMLGLDLVLHTFSNDFILLRPVYKISSNLLAYMIIAWFASVAWLAVVLVLACTRRYRYVLKDFIINLFFWTASACLLVIILWSLPIG